MYKDFLSVLFFLKTLIFKNFFHVEIILCVNSQNMTDHDTIVLSLTILYVITMIVALAGNTLLIYIVFRKPGTRNLTSFLFVNMAVADLMVAVFQMPVSIMHFYVFESSDLIGAFICRFQYYAVYATTIASISCLTVMAFDRYFAVVHPFRRSIWFRKPKIITPIIWISSMALMSIVPFTFKLDQGKCWIETSLMLPFYAYFFAVGFLLPLAVISVLYTLVARKLWLHEVPLDHNISENQREQEVPKKKVIRMLIIVVLVFAVCWLPVHVYQMDEGVSVRVESGGGANWDPYVIIYICYWFSQANSAINPWLYIGLNGKIKAAFKNMIRCRREVLADRGQLLTLTTTRNSRTSSANTSLLESTL